MADEPTRVEASFASDARVSDAELDRLCGGFRVGRFDVELLYRLRERVDGVERLIFERRLAAASAPGTAGATARPTTEPAAEARASVFAHGPRFVVRNLRDDVVVRNDLDLELRIRNFSSVLGSPRTRAARSLASRLAAGGAQ